MPPSCACLALWSPASASVALATSPDADQLSAAAAVLSQRPILSLPRTWDVGDRLRLDMVRDRANYGGITQISGGDVRATVDPEVLRRLPDGNIMRWPGPASP